MRILILFIIVLFSCSFAYPDENSKKKENTSVISIYQNIISPIDGERCTMYPSCSHYSRQAFKKHGFIKGFIMSCDRLLRCGGDEKKFSKIIVINGRKYVYDPVENN